MKTIGCDDARSHLSDALAGEIARPDANLLEAHLQDCAACREQALVLAWQDRVIAELSAQNRIEATLSRVRTRIAGLAQESFGEPRLESVSKFRRPLLTAAAAALLLALAGAFLWRPSPPPSGGLVVLPAVKDASRPSDPPEPEIRGPVDIRPLPDTVAELPKVDDPRVEAVKKTPAVEAPAPVAPPRKLAIQPPDPPVIPAPVPVKPAPRAVVEDVVSKPRSLDEAVRAGTAFLRARAAGLAKDSKAEELLLWALLHGGVPETDPEFQRLLRQVLERKLDRTYNVALQAMLLEELDRVKYQVRLLQCAQFLVDNQCLNGQWSYGHPSLFVEEIAGGPLGKELAGGMRRPGVRDFGADPKVQRKLPVKKQREGPATGDNSNAQIAALGLRACHDAGIVLPREVLDLAARWWRDSQTRTEPGRTAEGWCYGKHEHKPYGSMTAGGVGSLVIYDYLLGRDWHRDREVASGMAWLGKNFSVDFNPGPFEHAGFAENSQHHLNYYLYALERAAILYGTPEIGKHEWFAKIAPALLARQRPDGAWASKEGGGDLVETSFAVLFLRRATRALPDVATPRK